MTETKTCHKCGQNLPADAPAGVCPKCLLAAGLDSIEEDGIAATEGLSTAGQTAPLKSIHYFGDYELLEEIARGGMGVVYKGRQTSLNRTVALKMILSGELAGPQNIERFQNEAEAAANLKHPNIVAIHEVGQFEGRYYFSMDYVEGPSLADVIQAGPLPVRKAAEYMKTIAEAVHFAHQRGTLHRDLKPQNVLIDADNQPQITDFGLAKRVSGDSGLTATGAVLGTPSYMSPEQASGRPADMGPHSDVYSLGAMLYELLTGRPPFCAASAVATLRQVTDNPPTAPHRLKDDLPQDIETICLKCLEKSPHARYHSARELADELGRFLNHQPIQAKPASAVRRVETWLRQRPWAIAAAASLAVMVLAGVIYFQFQQNLLLQYEHSHSDYVREAGQRTERLGNWSLGIVFCWLAVVIGYLAHREKSYRLTDWRQFFDRKTQLADPQPVSATLRVVCSVIGLSSLAYAVLIIAMTIEAYVWEGYPDVLGLAFMIWALCWFALWLLLRVGHDYRQATYGQPSRQIDDETLNQMRQSLLGGELASAMRIYRQAVPEAGVEEIRRFVVQLAARLEAEDPERWAASQPKPWEINWRAVGICLAVEVVVLLAIWSLMSPSHFGVAATRVFGWSLFGGTMIVGARFRKNWKQKVLAISVATLGFLIASVAPEMFAQPKTSHGPLGWPFVVGILGGTFLAISAYTRRRRVRGQ